MKNKKGLSLIALIIIIVVIIVGILLFKSISNKNEIVGSWRAYIITSSQTSGNLYATYIFNEDSTGSTSAFGITKEFTYKVKSNKISITYIENESTFEVEYSIKKDKLYLGEHLKAYKR